MSQCFHFAFRTDFLGCDVEVTIEVLGLLGLVPFPLTHTRTFTSPPFCLLCFIFLLNSLRLLVGRQIYPGLSAY